MTDSRAFIPPENQNVHFDRATGKLYVFDLNCIKVYPSGVLRCWCKSQGHPHWKGHRPLMFPNPYAYSCERWRRFQRQGTSSGPSVQWDYRVRWGIWEWLQTFDREFSQELRHVDPSLMWGALSVHHQSRVGPEIFASNPAFALLCYYGWWLPFLKHRPHKPGRAMRTWLRRRRRELLGRLEMPAEERGVRLLGKLELKGLNQYHIAGFCDLWRKQSPWIEHFQHLPRILPVQIEAVFELMRLGGENLRLHPRCVLEEGQQRFGEHGMDLPSLLLDTRLLEQDLQRISRNRPLPRSLARRLEKPVMHSSAEALHNWHEQMTHYLLQVHEEEIHGIGLSRLHEDMQDPDQSFPAGPMPPEGRIESKHGVVTVQFLSTPRDVVEHAGKQRNCMSGYIQPALEGQVYLYEVSADFTSRHSLSLLPRENGKGVCIGQLAGPRNTPEDPKVRQALCTWVGERYSPPGIPGPGELPVPAVLPGEEDYPF